MSSEEKSASTKHKHVASDDTTKDAVEQAWAVEPEELKEQNGNDNSNETKFREPPPEKIRADEENQNESPENQLKSTLKKY
ncbi:hypothetical protein [Myxosarcina sp. GI1(2024)]